MGKNEKTLLDLAARQNMPIPDKILNAPDLEPGLQLYMDCFNDLNHSRFNSSGFVGRLHYNLIDLWCNNNGVYGDQKLAVIHIIGKLDFVYVTWQFEQMKKIAEAEARKNKGKQPRNK
jgi:hypothetical protein